jgi:hypothetical protein
MNLPYFFFKTKEAVFSKMLLHVYGRAMAQAVFRQLSTAEVQFRF